MTISGFSFVRNGFTYDVPFLESIQSILPICDEFVVAVGDSTDSTVEAIEALNNPKIKIIHTIWDETKNQFGKIFAQQANIALQHTTGDWAFHLQADEVIHEQDLDKIVQTLKIYHTQPQVQGFILPFLHFYGAYNYIRTSRRVHKHEVRIFRNDLLVRSYKDSQGFRLYSSDEAYEKGLDKGTKLKVKKIDAPIYHYTEVRPRATAQKHQIINQYYKELPENQVEGNKTDRRTFYDRLVPFTGTHPKVMEQTIKVKSFDFTFNKADAQWRLKDRIMTPIEDLLGFRIGEFRNYVLLK